MRPRSSGWAALLSTLVALFGCDPQSAGECEDASVDAGKGDDARDEPDPIEDLVLAYFESWQEADWETYREALASRIHVDAGFAEFDDPDAFTEASQQGHPFRDVELVELFTHAAGATLVYTATDSVTRAPVRVSELITVGVEGEEYEEPRLVITAITATIAIGTAPRESFSRPRAELKFAPFFPDQPNGPSFALLWGDLESSASGFLLRVPAGFPGFAHTHSAAYHGIVLEGINRNGLRIADAPDLPAGSYWSQAGGAKHTTACVSEVDCLSLVMFDGPFDAIPVP